MSTMTTALLGWMTCAGAAEPFALEGMFLGIDTWRGA